MGRAADQVQGVGIHNLQRHGCQRQEIEDRRAHILKVAKMDQRRGGRQRPLHQFYGRFADDAEGPFAADKQLGQIDDTLKQAVGQAEKVVAGAVLRDRRLFAVDQRGMLTDKT